MISTMFVQLLLDGLQFAEGETCVQNHVRCILARSVLTSYIVLNDDK